ncbi:MAG TPA: NBR1-Ig-like domain-containing protein [Anaerolineaceae bacterium]|nr:NBR1-Ig-like domain-containing protein [Anaerolineaceae bacterium]
MPPKSILFKLFAAIIVLTILGGCTSPTPQPTATPIPFPTATLAPTVDQNLINTQAAQTATANAPTESPVPPSATPTDTQAPTVTLTPSDTATITPTFTSLPPTAFPTWTLSPFTLTPSSTPSGYACTVTSTTPKSTDTVKVSTNFGFTWVIQNTGSKLWGQHNADLKYVSGASMQTKNLFDFTQDVRPGASYTATVTMNSPATAGTYSATWEIVQDGVVVCTFNLSVKVVN